jgi:hypothetical protein
VVSEFPSGTPPATPRHHTPCGLVADPVELRSRGDIQGALGCYEADAPIVTEPRHVSAGADAVRGVDPFGSELRLAGRSSDVARRRSDGTWLIAIDNQWGSGDLDPRNWKEKSMKKKSP